MGQNWSFKNFNDQMEPLLSYTEEEISLQYYYNIETSGKIYSKTANLPNTAEKGLTSP